MTTPSTITLSDSVVECAILRGIVAMGILRADIAKDAEIHVYRQVDGKTGKEKIGVRITLKN